MILRMITKPNHIFSNLNFSYEKKRYNMCDEENPTATSRCTAMPFNYLLEEVGEKNDN